VCKMPPSVETLFVPSKARRPVTIS
jgi:hypothetical protein